MKWGVFKMALGLVLCAVSGCQAEEKVSNATETKDAVVTETATFGGGCFWCMEALLETLDGVETVVSGYAGGETEHPTYEEVCSGTSGHAEVVQVTFDPAKISYDELLDQFWKSHDPTTLNRQGPDVGSQYRSVIFYRNQAQKDIALASKKRAAGWFADPIVTEIVPFKVFYPAEGYHQDYYRRNPSRGYCYFVIRPKLAKFKHGK